VRSSSRPIVRPKEPGVAPPATSRAEAIRSHRTLVGVRLQADQIKAIDAWAVKQNPPVSRPEAIATGAKRGSPSLALDAALMHTFQILIMSRLPPRCRRAEANSPTLELTSGTDGPWFDLAITQWYPTDGRIGAP
jgi:hypothetical protein